MDTQDIRDIRPPFHIPQLGLWLAAIAVICVLAALVVVAWRRRQRRMAALRKSAQELALERLAAARALLAPENAGAFSLAVSGILRSYIEEHFHIQAAHRTTLEFLRACLTQADGSLAQHRQQLESSSSTAILQSLPAGCCPSPKWRPCSPAVLHSSARQQQRRQRAGVASRLRRRRPLRSDSLPGARMVVAVGAGARGGVVARPARDRGRRGIFQRPAHARRRAPDPEPQRCLAHLHQIAGAGVPGPRYGSSQTGSRTVQTQVNGIDIMLLLDVSGSMRSLDFRLEGHPASRGRRREIRGGEFHRAAAG